MPPALRCPLNFYSLGDSACFAFNATALAYNDAEAACLALSDEREIHLATILDGYESALIETMTYALDLDGGWIGLRSNNVCVSVFWAKCVTAKCRFNSSVCN